MRIFGYDTEYWLERLKRPKTPEGVARKIVLLIKHETILFLIKPIISEEIALRKKSQDEQAVILHDIFVNGICFATMFLQNIGEISKGPRAASFYNEVSVEVRSAYGNYKKKTDKEAGEYWSGLVNARLREFRDVYEKNKDELTPMPKGNPWQYVTGLLTLYVLRKKIKEKDPITPELKKWLGKVENIALETCEEGIK